LEFLFLGLLVFNGNKLKTVSIAGTRGYSMYSSTSLKMRNATLLQGHGERYTTWVIRKQQQATTLPPRKGRSKEISSNTGLTPQLAQYSGKIG